MSDSVEAAAFSDRRLCEHKQRLADELAAVVTDDNDNNTKTPSVVLAETYNAEENNV